LLTFITGVFGCGKTTVIEEEGGAYDGKYYAAPFNDVVRRNHQIADRGGFTNVFDGLLTDLVHYTPNAQRTRQIILDEAQAASENFIACVALAVQRNIPIIIMGDPHFQGVPRSYAPPENKINHRVMAKIPLHKLVSITDTYLYSYTSWRLTPEICNFFMKSTGIPIVSARADRIVRVITANSLEEAAVLARTICPPGTLHLLPTRDAKNSVSGLLANRGEIATTGECGGASVPNAAFFAYAGPSGAALPYCAEMPFGKFDFHLAVGITRAYNSMFIFAPPNHARLNVASFNHDPALQAHQPRDLSPPVRAGPRNDWAQRAQVAIDLAAGALGEQGRG